MKTIKKLNPYTKRGLIQARVDNEEMQTVVTKAVLYTQGDLSKFVRLACLNYRPVKNTKAGK